MSKEREALEAIEHALRMGFSPATVLDENSPIRDGIRAALASPAAEPVQALTDERIDTVTDAQWGQQIGSMYQAHRAYARAIEAEVLAIASPPATKEAKE